MPVKRTHLSRAEQAQYLAWAKELQSAQVDCEVPENWQENSQDLDIFTAAPGANILCELPSRVTAYGIWVHLTSLRRNLRLEDCTIASAWDLQSITLCTGERGLYRVGQAIAFTEAEVLNKRIENGLCFHQRGDVADGWLVASSLMPIPDEYRNWMITKLTLTFTDQFGHDHTAHAVAGLQRSADLQNVVSRVRKSLGLFEIQTPKSEILPREVPAGTPRRQPQGLGGEVSMNRDDSTTTTGLRHGHAQAVAPP